MIEHIESRERQTLARDIIPVDDMRISTHALGQFLIRTGADLVEAADQMRERISTSQRIRRHEYLDLVPRTRDGRPVYFFQDKTDERVIYVVERDKRGRRFTLTTALV